AAMGGVGDKAFDKALAAVQKHGSSPLAGSSRSDSESASPRSPSVGFQSLHSLASPIISTPKEHVGSPLLPSLHNGGGGGGDGYDDEATRQMKGKEVVQKVGHSSGVALAIDTSSNGHVSEHGRLLAGEAERGLSSALTSASVVDSFGAQFMVLWHRPAWKVGITFAVLWVLNFISP
ncbi:hypothetical protein DFQ27_005328, partial [Actinomortierella ambigua]